MPYNQEISRATPGYIVILIDQSFSMEYAFGAAGTRAEECAKAVNRVLRETVLACTDGDEIKNSCDVSVLGYGKQRNKAVNALSGNLASKPVVTVQELAENCMRVETLKRKVSDGAGGLVEIEDQFPIWIEPVAVGGTPMTAAFEMACGLVQDWTENHKTSFPPVAINITDGEAESQDTAKTAAEILTELGTDDGKTLLLNAHISGGTEPEVILPSSLNQLPKGDSYAQFLFDISSELPPLMLERASASGLTPSPYAKGFVYKARLETMIQLLEIGTKAEFRG
ncbi:MAG: VWA domain-containing protein [Chroococcidiopsidaceae cyanobacterium CP_BM_RX_35]|nr:VWA domain-containing protein [Chroococcidiopsidaceae cyanobacterium CP_BM_RX_35]